jgi:RimJ/RimL family protein N-acetyltransferase
MPSAKPRFGAKPRSLERHASLRSSRIATAIRLVARLAWRPICMALRSKWVLLGLLRPKNPPMPLNLLPEQLESPRLLIRVAKPGDGPAFNEAVVASLNDLAPWLGWVTPPPTVEQSEANCRRGYARYLLNEDLMVFFFEKNSGALVGGSGLHGPDWATRKFEVGYWCRTGYGGKGLITEGVRALSDYALNELGAARVFLTCDDKNTRSWKLAERAGFTLEGILVNERLNLRGELRNTRSYARTAA